MQNSNRLRMRAGPRSALLFGIVLLAVSACETTEVTQPPPPIPEVPEEPEPVEVIEPEPEPVLSDVIVRLHVRSDEAMPPGAIAVVTLERSGETFEREMPKGARLVRFDAIEIGRYDLRVTVNSGGAEIGAYSYFIDLDENVGDFTVSVDYQRADLLVDAAVETTVMRRRYTGRGIFDAEDCLGQGADNPARLDMMLYTDGDSMSLDFVSAAGDTTQLSGRLQPGSSPLAARGAFALPDGMTGPWNLVHLSEPAPGAVAVLVELENTAGACQATLEFAGLLEDPPSMGGLTGGQDALATVEVLGHGQTQAVTLERDEPLARFEGLLVGSYDILVEWRHAEGTLATHRESVVLGAEGARVGTIIETEWPMPADAPLAARGDYPLLAHTFAGKSFVTNGAPECTGSIPLVDTTTLTLTAEDEALGLQFDNFYGRVLKLSGAPGEGNDTLAASGTYSSNGAQMGTWTIDSFAVPTPGIVALSVSFQNETDSCRADYLFTGVR